jgi:hypothetical protein
VVIPSNGVLVAQSAAVVPPLHVRESHEQEFVGERTPNAIMALNRIPGPISAENTGKRRETRRFDACDILQSWRGRVMHVASQACIIWAFGGIIACEDKTCGQNS